MGGHTIRHFDPTETSGFASVLSESLDEGHHMLRRLQENWVSGRNRFDRPGELLLAAFSEGELAGICGRNIDPYADDTNFGRVRHMYVRAKQRRSGVGGLLIEKILTNADRYFEALNARAPRNAFPFYEAVGFEPVSGDEFVPHRLWLRAR